MNFWSNLFRATSLAGLAGLTAIGMASGPAASFEVSSGAPSAGSPVQFSDTSTGAPASWLWTFGDGSSSILQSPTHAFAAAGIYPVTLRVTDSTGSTQTTLTVEVLAASTLRLLSQTGHPFDVTLSVTDPRTGDDGVGQAVPQNDVFGYFTAPTLSPTVPGAPATPEVFVKMQDARDSGGDFWVFWGGLTELTYTLTIRDTVTGATKVKNYSAADRPACEGADTSGFQGIVATHVVNVGQGGNQFVDAQGGGKTTSIQVGETVQWNWMGGPHTSTSGECRGGGGDPYGGGPVCDDLGIWDSGPHAVPYQYSRTFTSPGTYQYFCRVHGAAMTAKVIVSGDSPATTPTPTVTSVPGGVAERQLDGLAGRALSREPRTVQRPTPPAGPPVATATPTSPGTSPTPTPTVTPTPPTGQARVVSIRNTFFSDSVSGNNTTTIGVGTTVEWHWDQGFHSTTSGPCPPCTGDGTWNSLPRGSGTFQHTFAQQGTFPYFCLVHTSMMTGTVVVNP
jgi:PKD repeat protein